MIQIRQNIFETNSSSVHSIAICNEDEFKQWENGELLYDRYNDELISLKKAEEIKREKEKEIERYKEEYGDEDYYDENADRILTYDQFFHWQGDDSYLDYMEKYQVHQNIDGVNIVAFGYYGHD